MDKSEAELKEAAVAMLEVVAAMGATIRELGEIPSGILYANVMHVFDVHQYEQIIGRLCEIKMIKRRGHMLVWIGPEVESGRIA